MYEVLASFKFSFPNVKWEGDINYIKITLLSYLFFFLLDPFTLSETYLGNICYTNNLFVILIFFEASLLGLTSTHIMGLWELGSPHEIALWWLMTSMWKVNPNKCIKLSRKRFELKIIKLIINIIYWSCQYTILGYKKDHSKNKMN